MERTLSQEERIRRAEEIYNRRKQCRNDRMDYYSRPERSNTNIKMRLTKKVVIQLIVCLFIYLGIYAIQNSDSIFSKELSEKINEFLSYDIQFTKIYDHINTYFKNNPNILGGFFSTEAGEKQEENLNEVNTENIENTQNIEILDNNIEGNEENVQAIGGAVEEVSEVQKSQTDIDIDYIKNNYDIIWPLVGKITSKFGTREATEIVTANHYGIDIGGNIGDTIIAAMDGIVTLVSSEGDYGKHIQIQNGEVTTLYAHCSVLCVEEGNQVSKGEKIAEVGATGRVTGPHLHFEIKRDGRVLDPQAILGEM